MINTERLGQPDPAFTLGDIVFDKRQHVFGKIAVSYYERLSRQNRFLLRCAPGSNPPQASFSKEVRQATEVERKAFGEAIRPMRTLTVRIEMRP